MLDRVMASVRHREDFHRITYETLQQAPEHGVRHREMFWNPTTHMACGVPDETAVDVISAGIRDACADFGIPCVLIAGINRMGPPELVQTVLAHPRDEVIGIGMDYAEAEHPPQQFWKAYRLAGQRGLRRTAHASEGASARNVETCLDLLGCERIDHGDHVMEDGRITKRCADQGVVFSCCPRSTAWVYFGEDLTHHPIREMARRGLKIMVDCDDPPMFQTDPTNDYMAMVEHMECGPADVREFVLNGIDRSRLDDPTKRRWRREWSREIDDSSPSSPDVTPGEPSTWRGTTEVTVPPEHRSCRVPRANKAVRARLGQDLQRIAAALWQLIEDEDTVVCQRHLARQWRRLTLLVVKNIPA